MSYRQISLSVEAARLGVDGHIVLKFDRYLVKAAAEAPVKCQVQTQISRLRVFRRSCGKTSVRFMNKGPSLVMKAQTVRAVA